jgi:serine/threonine protein kinase
MPNRFEPADAADPLLGRTLGEFLIRQRLRGGSSAVVYRAEQLDLGREAVVKVLTGGDCDEDDARRFIRAARLAARLNHPYAAHVYAFGQSPDGLLWMAMELVDGQPLDELLRTQGPFSLERFVPLFDQICEVVQSAHDLGIVHRDLKPANVMIRSQAGHLFPKLLDFGLAKWFGVSGRREPEPEPDRPGLTPSQKIPVLVQGPDGYVTPVRAVPPAGLSKLPAAPPPPQATAAAPEADAEEERDTTDADGGELRFTRLESMRISEVTRDGVLLGSPVYMAPEQWADSSTVDFRADLYALAVLAFEAITGHVPFSGGSLAELAGRHGIEPVPVLGPSFPPALDEVMTRALAKLPWERHSSASELAAAFKAAALTR